MGRYIIYHWKFEYQNISRIARFLFKFWCIWISKCFRKTISEYYKLEPCNYVDAPSLAGDAMLLMTGVELDLLNDSDMSLFFEPGICGGQSRIFNKYAEANNKYMVGQF